MWFLMKKFLMRQCDDVYLLIFPIKIFIREIRKTYTILIVFLLNYLKRL
jgi:hypothetical protein